MNKNTQTRPAVASAAVEGQGRAIGRNAWRKTMMASAALAMPVLAACTGPAIDNPTTVAEAREIREVQAQTDYLLGPGDDLDIRFYYNPEMDTEVVVRPDGKISLPLVDELEVSGRSVSAVAADLRERYSNELRNPEVAVIVRGFAGNRYYVGGEVADPGVITMPGQISALQALMESGGLLTTARSEEIAIVRRVPDRDPIVIAVNIDDVLSGRATEQDLMLQPQDVVFVPRSSIAEVNRFIDLYIRQNIPVGVGVGIPIGGSD